MDQTHYLNQPRDSAGRFLALPKPPPPTPREDARLVKQYLVWDLLRERGPMAPGAIRATLGLSLSSTLRAMRRSGSVVATGETSARTYRAGKTPIIKQRRTNTLEQQAGLNRGRMIGLRRMIAKRYGRVYVPRAEHPLELAWGRGVEMRG